MGRKEDLGFYWIAEFKNGSKIVQFDKEGNETLFKEVEDNKEDLVKFFIVSHDVKEEYIADLVNKMLIGPNVSYELTGKNPELIYKRRNRVRMEVGSGNIIDPSVTHILGIKTDTEEKQFEVFAGQGMKPKKVDITDLKSSDKLDITEDVKNLE